MIHRCTIGFLFLLGLCTSLAQAPVFHHYAIGSSLPGAEKINLLYEDPLGPVWVGTSEGLFLFDGQQFYEYRRAERKGHVTAIFRDRDHLLWVAYQDGSICHLKNGQLQKWWPQEGTPSAPVNTILQDERGQLWFSTYGEGVYYWNGQRMYNIDREDGLLENDIYVMRKDATGRMWCGTDAGISICRADKSKKTITNLTTADGLPDEIVRSLLMDGQRGCWIGMNDRGFCYYDFSTKSFSQPLPDWNKGVINSLQQFAGQELWIGTEGNGLWRYSFAERQLLAVGSSVSQIGTKIFDLDFDAEGNLWVISNSKFISRAYRPFEMLLTDLPPIQSLLHDRDNRLWIGTERGLFSMEKDTAGMPYYKMWLNDQPVNVLSLYADSLNNIWAGSFGNGVYCVAPGREQWMLLGEKEGITNGSILSIAGKKDYIWLATLGGVTQYTGTKNLSNGQLPQARNYNEESGLGTNFIYKAFTCSKNNIWFGTDGKGLSVLEADSIRTFGQAPVLKPDGTVEELPLKTIYSITEDEQGDIWFSTSNAGIFEWNGFSFRHFRLTEGITDLGLSGLEATRDDQILLVHNSGIALMDQQNGQLTYFDESIGLQQFEPSLNALSKDQLGNVWLAGKRELIKYTPGREKRRTRPRIYLKKITIGLEPADLLSGQVFTHQDNNFQLQYLGLWYTDPERVKYRYRLLGVEDEWRYTGDRMATYSRLTPGDYRFELAASVEGSFSETPAIEYAFSINPPFWSTWWFLLLMSLLTISAILLWQKWRDDRLKKVGQLEREKVFSQLNALKSQISPHFLFNSFNTLVGVIEENPRQAVEYVEQLSDFYRAILQYRDKEMIPLEEEIALLNNYTYLLQKRYGDNLNLNIRLKPDTTSYIPPLSLQILVENAIKHNIISKDKPLYINIYHDLEYIYVENNSQPKLSSEQSTRFGLESLRKRYKALSKLPLQISYDDRHFKVDLPILKNA